MSQRPAGTAPGRAAETELSGPAVSVPAVSGPAVSGPAASGPAASGPAASGPVVSGTAASGPVVSGTAGPGLEPALYRMMCWNGCSQSPAVHNR